MSYKRKRGLKITKFFSDYDFNMITESCKRYHGLMEMSGVKKVFVHWSSIQRFDAVCEVPSEMSGSVAIELHREIDRDLPNKTSVGEAHVTDLGGGMSRVQIPVFPM